MIGHSRKLMLFTVLQQMAVIWIPVNRFFFISRNSTVAISSPFGSTIMMALTILLGAFFLATNMTQGQNYFCVMPWCRTVAGPTSTEPQSAGARSGLYPWYTPPINTAPQQPTQQNYNRQGTPVYVYDPRSQQSFQTVLPSTHGLKIVIN